MPGRSGLVEDGGGFTGSHYGVALLSEVVAEEIQASDEAQVKGRAQMAGVGRLKKFGVLEHFPHPWFESFDGYCFASEEQTQQDERRVVVELRFASGDQWIAEIVAGLRRAANEVSGETCTAENFD